MAQPLLALVAQRVEDPVEVLDEHDDRAPFGGGGRELRFELLQPWGGWRLAECRFEALGHGCQEVAVGDDRPGVLGQPRDLNVRRPRARRSLMRW